MVPHCGRVADDDEFHSCTGDGHVHAAQVSQKAYLPLLVGPDERDDDDIALLSLKSINGIDADEVAVGLEECMLSDESAQQLYLCPIR